MASYIKKAYISGAFIFGPALGIFNATEILSFSNGKYYFSTKDWIGQTTVSILLWPMMVPLQFYLEKERYKALLEDENMLLNCQ
jgi:hypothetical protein